MLFIFATCLIYIRRERKGRGGKEDNRREKKREFAFNLHKFISVHANSEIATV